MARLLLPAPDLERMIARRRRLGLDHHDEVWDGVYFMAPIANDEHQELATMLASSFVQASLPTGTKVRVGVNISDRLENWTQNYRVPDVAVFLPDTRAICKDTHWLGGPDFVVEIRSKDDRSRKKMAFYAAVGTREVLLVDRDPWALELYRPEAGKLKLAGKATLEDGEALNSEVLPLRFRLTAGPNRPIIRVERAEPAGVWDV